MRTAHIQRDTLGDEHLTNLRTICNITRVHQVHNEHLQAIGVCIDNLLIGKMILGQTHCFVVEILIMSGTILYELEWGELDVDFFKKVIKNIDEPNRHAEEFLTDCISTLSTSNMISGTASA